MDISISIGDHADGLNIVTLNQAKKHVKVDHEFEDDVLQMYLDGIVPEFESYLGTYIFEREIEIGLPYWLYKYELPVSKVSEVVSVTYKDVNGDEQTVDLADVLFYSYDGPLRQRVIFKMNPLPALQDVKDEPFPITLKVKVGFKPSKIPKDIKHAALLAFGSAEMFREGMPVKFNNSIYAKLRPYKKY